MSTETWGKEPCFLDKRHFWRHAGNKITSWRRPDNTTTPAEYQPSCNKSFITLRSVPYGKIRTSVILYVPSVFDCFRSASSGISLMTTVCTCLFQYPYPPVSYPRVRNVFVFVQPEASRSIHLFSLILLVVFMFGDVYRSCIALCVVWIWSRGVWSRQLSLTKECFYVSKYSSCY